MFIIDLRYIAPPAEVEKHMEAHTKHLNHYYDKNIFLAWGPKVPWTGGVIFALAETREALENILREDPFYQLKIAEFTITELSPAKVQPALKSLFG